MERAGGSQRRACASLWLKSRLRDPLGRRFLAGLGCASLMRRRSERGGERARTTGYCCPVPVASNADSNYAGVGSSGASGQRSPSSYPDSDCTGMCGPTCNCMLSIGDCCWHQLCADHDRCCDQRGYTSSACYVRFLPMWFLNIHAFISSCVSCRLSRTCSTTTCSTDSDFK